MNQLVLATQDVNIPASLQDKVVSLHEAYEDDYTWSPDADMDEVKWVISTNVTSTNDIEINWVGDVDEGIDLDESDTPDRLIQGVVTPMSWLESAMDVAMYREGATLVPKTRTYIYPIMHIDNVTQYREYHAYGVGYDQVRYYASSEILSHKQMVLLNDTYNLVVGVVVDPPISAELSMEKLEEAGRDAWGDVIGRIEICNKLEEIKAYSI